MAGITHIALGLAVGRLYAGRPSLGASLVFAGLSFLPDVDFIGHVLGVPYASAFGHRGATHSLVFAAGVGLIGGCVERWRNGGGLRAAGFVGLTVASHPLLDALTTGGLGVALLWPWSEERFFAPVRPIPVSPMGLGVFTARGLRVMAAEALPSLILALLARMPARGGRV